MYGDFRTKLAMTILTSKIVNIFFNNNEEIIIGLGGLSPEQIKYYSFGFAVQKDSGALFWYSYQSIARIEVY